MKFAKNAQLRGNFPVATRQLPFLESCEFFGDGSKLIKINSADHLKLKNDHARLFQYTKRSKQNYKYHD